MKTKFTEYLLESKQSKILYHGSLSGDIKEFKNTTTFFSETKQFAIDYAEQKSMDYGIDNSVVLYTVKVDGDIFDINVEEDYNKLKKVLPEDIKYIYNDFGFNTTEEKEKMLFHLKGFINTETYTEYRDLKPGDVFPDPSYDRENFIVYKIDDNYLHYYTENTKNWVNRDTRKKHSPIFNNLYNFFKKYIKENDQNLSYVSDDHINACEYLFVNGQNSYYDIKKPSQDKIIEYKKLVKEFDNAIIDIIVDKNRIYKLPMKSSVEKLKNTWRYYENDTVSNAIKKLGYCGYIALEKGVKTYAIFNAKSVKIIDKSK